MWNRQNSAVSGWVVRGMGVCLFLCLIGTASAQESTESAKASLDDTSKETVSTHDQEFWKQLGLVHTEINGSQIWYDPSFEDKLLKFKDVYGRFLQSSNRPDPPALDPNQILTRIGQILGTDEATLEKARPFLSSTLNLPKSFVWNPRQATLVFAGQKRIKSFLRKGGELSGFTYDKTTDTAVYSMNTKFWDSKSPTSAFELILPIGPESFLDDDIKTLFEKLQNFKGIPPGVAIHEAAEAALILSIKRDDRYWRWFSEGIANAVAARLLHEMIGPQAAEEHLQGFSTEPYEDIKGQINLRYWMAANYCIETELEDEKRLTNARYAYATHEIQRLVETHGLDCIRKIADILVQQLSVTSQTICQAIHKVTGEDMNERLTDYQQFRVPQEGVSVYSSAYQEAVKAEDYKSLLTVLLRMMELERNLISGNGLNLYIRAAAVLAKIGREQEADAVMEMCIEMFAKSNMPKGRELAIMGFLPYALSTNKPQKLAPYAEELLESDPNHFGGMVIKMLSLAQTGELSQARMYAEKVMSQNPDKGSKVYKLTQQVLDAKKEE